MSEVVYRIVEHDGGWIYKLGDVFSEIFASRADAEAAAEWVAAQQRTPGEDGAISCQDYARGWAGFALTDASLRSVPVG